MNWLQIYPGAQFYPQNPNGEVISIDAIALVLSRTLRFGGHTVQPYTVAEHCIRVSQLCTGPRALPALLHDAHEALSGFGDVAAPVKGLAPIIGDIERLIDFEIAARYGFDPHLFYHPEIKEADLTMLATEKRDLMAQEPAPWGALPPPLPGRITVPLSSFTAETIFLDTFYKLKGK